MKRIFSTFIFLVGLFSMATATEKNSTIGAEDLQYSLTGASAHPHSTQQSSQLSFTGFNENARLAGIVAITIVPYGTGATDSLTVWVRPIVTMPSDNLITTGLTKFTGELLKVSQADQITLVTELDWTTDTAYQYPVTAPFGACRGLEVTVRYTSQAGTGDEVEVIVFATIQ